VRGAIVLTFFITLVKSFESHSAEQKPLLFSSRHLILAFTQFFFFLLRFVEKPEMTEQNKEGFKLFRSWVSLQRVNIDYFGSERVWKYYDWGPKDVPPLVCIPGVR